MGQHRAKLSFANVMSVIAVFIALGSGAFAAIQIEKNSIKSRHIKDGGVKSKDLAENAVVSPKVANGSLLREDFAAGQLPQGEQGEQGEHGEQGEQGEQGLAGTATAYARVDSNVARTIQVAPDGFPPQSKGIEQREVVPGEAGAATGTTCFDLSFRPASAIVALDNADAGANVDRIISVAIDRGEDLGDCPAAFNDARVRIVDTDLTAGGAEQDPGPVDARFFIWFE
jgi:hypothetical protein